MYQTGSLKWGKNIEKGKFRVLSFCNLFLFFSTIVNFWVSKDEIINFCIPRSKSDNVFRMHNAAAFAENTISSVQAALFKYQSQIHELQVRILMLSVPTITHLIRG